MSASFYDLMKYAHTGLATADMTAFDKLRAQEMAGGGTIKTLTGVPPLSFRANGKPLISWSMLGNSQQTGTPSPDNIIMPEFCGKLVGTDWIIPITNAGQTTPVYLGQVQTTRKIKKLVLDGTENWIMSESWKRSNTVVYFFELAGINTAGGTSKTWIYSDRFPAKSRDDLYNADYNCIARTGNNAMTVRIDKSIASTRDDFKAWLSDQYAAGTPVTIWYVLSEPETGVVNEPLCKIGDYADELHSEDAGITIPTAKGANTLTVDTDLKPSSMTITYR